MTMIRSNASTSPSPLSAIMPLLGTSSAFVALVSIGFALGTATIMTMM